jgi:hypothetical protein
MKRMHFYATLTLLSLKFAADDVVVVQVGDNATLTCTNSMKYPYNSSVRWIYYALRGSTTEQIVFSKDVFSDNFTHGYSVTHANPEENVPATLRIWNVTLEHAGKFKCQSIKLGSELEQYIRLEVFGKPTDFNHELLLVQQ